MQINLNSIPVLNTEEGRQKAKTIGAPALLSAGAVMIGTRAPKGIQNNLKMATRIGRAGAAGLVTAGVIAALNINKEKVQGAIDTVKNIFKKGDKETQKPIEETSPVNENVETADIAQQAQINNEAPVADVQNLNAPLNETQGLAEIPAAEENNIAAASVPSIEPQNIQDTQTVAAQNPFMQTAPQEQV